MPALSGRSGILRKDTYYPRYDPNDPDPFFTIPAGSKLPISPDQKYYVSAEYGISRSSWGRTATHSCWVSPGATNSEIYNTIDGAIEKEDPETDLIPSWSADEPCSLATRATTGGKTRLIARNLFDETGYQLAQHGVPTVTISRPPQRRPLGPLPANLAEAADRESPRSPRNGSDGVARDVTRPRCARSPAVPRRYPQVPPCQVPRGVARSAARNPRALELQRLPDLLRTRRLDRSARLMEADAGFIEWQAAVIENAAHLRFEVIDRFLVMHIEHLAR